MSVEGRDKRGEEADIVINKGDGSSGFDISKALRELRNNRLLLGGRSYYHQKQSEEGHRVRKMTRKKERFRKRRPKRRERKERRREKREE